MASQAEARLLVRPLRQIRSAKIKSLKELILKKIKIAATLGHDSVRHECMLTDISVFNSCARELASPPHNFKVKVSRKKLKLYISW